MSLYTYVPGKGELLDLMLDTVYREQAGLGAAAGESLREQLEGLARRQWELPQRHPWTLYVASGRGVLGTQRARQLPGGALGRIGPWLSARDAVALIDSISLFVRGVARDAAEAEDAERVTGQRVRLVDVARRILTGKMTDERYPTLGLHDPLELPV